MNSADKLRAIKARMYSGEITYDEAKVLAKPILDEIDAASKVIAKKYGRRPTKASFAAFMR